MSCAFRGISTADDQQASNQRRYPSATRGLVVVGKSFGFGHFTEDVGLLPLGSGF
jgi:hypothetical protein